MLYKKINNNYKPKFARSMGRRLPKKPPNPAAPNPRESRKVELHTPHRANPSTASNNSKPKEAPRVFKFDFPVTDEYIFANTVDIERAYEMQCKTGLELEALRRIAAPVANYWGVHDPSARLYTIRKHDPAYALIQRARNAQAGTPGSNPFRHTGQ